MSKENVKHTPGPWVMDENCNIVGIADILERKAIGETEANARLIAAAPETAAERDRLKKINEELVFVCKKLLSQLQEPGDIKLSAKVYLELKAILAKAGDVQYQDQEENLAYLNDRGESFKTIAKLIKKQL